MRTGVAVAVAAAVLALGESACEEAGQEGAREVVEAYLRARPDARDYSLSDVHCTRSGRIGYIQSVRTRRYFCIARLAGSGDCDLFQADALTDGTAKVARVKRRAGCVLPAG
jgi:hypothetical protein